MRGRRRTSTNKRSDPDTAPFAQEPQRPPREIPLSVTHNVQFSQSVEDLNREAERRSFELTLAHVLRHHRKRAKPSELYHYTDAGGLLGVLKHGCAWASESRFLNDPDDCRYIFSLLNRPGVAATAEARELVRAVEEARSRIATGQTYTPPARVFVASFSTAKDDLDQWRSYAANGSGYAFCFDATKIGLDEANFVEVLYKIEDQLELLRFVVQRNAELVSTLEHEQNATHADAVAAVGHALVFELERIGPLMKHPAYKHEEEWRLFVYGHRRATEVPDRLELRVRGQSLVPYIEFPLAEASTNRVPLRSVWIGPAQDKTRAVLSVVLLLRKLGYYEGPHPDEPQPFGFFPPTADKGDGPPEPPYVFYSRVPYRAV